MNGQGISFVGPTFPGSFIGGFPATRVPYADATGLLITDAPLWYDVVGKILHSSGWTGNSVSVDADLAFGANGYLKQHVVSPGATPYNAGSDMVMLITTGAGAYIVNLPTAVGRTGITYTIKKVDAGVGVCTVTPNGAETIDGAANYALAAQWKFVIIVSDGANWVITGAN